MDNTTNIYFDLLILIILSALIGIIAGLIVRRSGYSFWRYAVTGFLASLGILALLWKIFREYI